MRLEKAGETEFPVHELIKKRWSPRAFADRPVESQKIGSLLEAARWAASCFNEQPWHFIIATRENPAEYERLLNCLVESNRAWAKRAPVLLLSVARLTFPEGGKPNRHAYHDVGLAVSQLVLQATAMGLVVHQMAGFSLEKARETYRIPDGYDPIAAIAIGYQGDPAILSDRLRERELGNRSRMALETFAFAGEWGRPWAG